MPSIYAVLFVKTWDKSTINSTMDQYKCARKHKWWGRKKKSPTMLRRRHENDKHKTSCCCAYFLKKNNKINANGRLLGTNSNEDEIHMNMCRVLHFPLFFASARVCHTHSMRTKNKHNRKWLIVVCLFFSLFVLSLFSFAFLSSSSKKFNFPKIHFIIKFFCRSHSRSMHSSRVSLLCGQLKRWCALNVKDIKIGVNWDFVWKKASIETGWLQSIGLTSTSEKNKIEKLVLSSS